MTPLERIVLWVIVVFALAFVLITAGTFGAEKWGATYSVYAKSRSPIFLSE
jgi:hypothetical protein